MSTLRNGEEFSLRELFSHDNKIVIPDLQRDYCWGDSAYIEQEKSQKELVSGFVGDYLLTSFKEKSSTSKDLMLGLVYGYEEPLNCFNICDGQQRITTLFLLLGMVNRYSDGEFNDYIISSTEMQDDYEPHLLYSIRESTLYFLSDLSLHFFIKNSIPNVSLIKKSNWYFDEYERDASVQSMLAALETIEKILVNEKTVDYKSFGHFLLNNLKMIYYDMENRARGEETYIVINTTGEPLSSTENIKPILLGSISDNKIYNEQWEEREDWFWQNRGRDLCADDGMKQFFIWFWQSKLLQEKTYKDDKEFPIDPRKEFLSIDKNAYASILDEVKSYFDALKYCVDVLNENEEINKQLHFIQPPKKNSSGTYSWLREQDNNIVLPLIGYIQKFKQPQKLNAFIRRIRRNWFDSIRNRHMSGEPASNTYFVDWRYMLQIIGNSTDEDEVLNYDTEVNSSSIRLIPNVRLNQWNNEDEVIKKDLCRGDAEKEKAVWEWEDNIDLMGDLSIFWKVLDSSSQWNKIQKVYNHFNFLLKCFCRENEKIIRDTNDPMTFNIANYYRLFRVLRGYYAPGHIDYTKNMNGAWFSWREEDPVYFYYLLDPALVRVLRADSKEELLSLLKEEVRKSVLKSGIVNNNLPNIDDDNFRSIPYLKLWLTAKALWAEKYGLLLSYWDGAGIAAWDDCQKNKIDPELPFTLANSHCGYAICRPANRIAYVSKENIDKEEYFDTQISIKKPIQEVDEEINELFLQFLKRESDDLESM